MKRNLTKVFLLSLPLLIIICTSCKKSDAEVDSSGTYKKSYKTYTDAQAAPGTLNVMTYNILWDKETTGRTQWSYRREGLVNLVKRHHPDIIGIQEGFINQVKYIRDELKYEYFGFGTDDGKPETDNPNRNQSLNPIVYNPERLELLEKGVFWYSDDPEVPNLGYSASHFRNCVWGKFREKSPQGQTIYVFNTHFSLADDIREKQAVLLLSKIKNIAGEHALTIVTGDFNSDPQRDNSYNVLTDASRPMHLTDSKRISTSPPLGPPFNGSGLVVNSRTKGYEVDHIFIRNISSCTAYKIIDDYEGDYYPSDHFPALAVLSFGDK